MNLKNKFSEEKTYSEMQAGKMKIEAKMDVIYLPKSSVHQRTLPHYFDNYVKQRQGFLSLNSSRSSQPPSDQRHPKADSFPLRGIDYSQTSIAEFNKAFANTHKCPPGDNMCDLCKNYFAKKQPNGYEAFLSHIFLRMGHSPELKQNAKRYIIQKPYPHLPAFVFSKYLHPKIFWREIRKPRDRAHREFQRRTRNPKPLNYQRNFRKVFKRYPNSPESNLDSKEKFEKIIPQLSEDDLSTTRRKSGGQSKSRKHKNHKKSLKSIKNKEDKEDKDETNESSKKESNGEEVSDSDDQENLKDENSNKKEFKNQKKQRKMERNRNKENEKSTAGFSESAESDEDISNISENNSNEENAGIKIEMQPPPLPSYEPKPIPTLPKRILNKQKMFLSKQQQNNNTISPNRSQPTSMFSYFGQSSIQASVDKTQLYSWLQRQLDFSLQACRFQLPIDGHVLENATPEDYLRHYCVVTPQFQSLYRKVFWKYQCPKIMKINFKNLESALRDVAVNNFNQEKMVLVQMMTGVNEESLIDYKLFCGIAALTERINIVSNQRLESEEKCEEQQHMLKERIEKADFSALDWKFKNVKISDKMKLILWTICS